MKRKILVCILLVQLTWSFAQTGKGRLFVGGMISASGSFSNNLAYSLQADPYCGVFVAPNLAVGLRLGFKTNFYSNAVRTVYSSLSPMIRYYIPSEERLRFFMGADIGYYYTYHNESNSFFKFAYYTTGITGGVGPGLAFFLNDNVALEGLIRWEFNAYYKRLSTILDNNRQLHFQIGLQVYLNTKRPAANK